jgi:hypothetical protein
MLMRLFDRKRRFIRANDGAAAIEFALALLCRADVSIMSSTAADLISQESSTSTADLTNVYAAAGTILYPYYTGGSTGKPTIRLTSVAYDSKSGTPTTAGRIAWTCTQPGSGTLTPATRANNDVVTFTQPLMTTNGSVIMAEVAYSYSSPTTQVVTGSINMTNNFYTKPRRVAQIATPTGGCPP